MEHWWSDNDRRKPKDSAKPCPSATLSTTNITWTSLGSNPDPDIERPANNRLNHGMALPSAALFNTAEKL
jgi:hypothetical protein